MSALILEPTIALRIAVRGVLVANPAVTALVPPESIRSGSTRPDRTPCIILTGGQTQYLGHASGGQHLARVFLDLHVWAVEDGAETAQAIGFAAANALRGFRDLTFPEIAIDEWAQPAFRWLRDPQPELAYTHGVADLEAVIRWRDSV